MKAYNKNPFGRRKPCHLRKKPRPHEWAIEAEYDYTDFPTEFCVVCENCLWGFNAEDVLGMLPTDGTSFEEES